MSTSISVPPKTRSIRIHSIGGLEVIQLDEIDTPTPQPDELLVKVEWAGVNFIDTYFRTGVYPVQFPFALGQEAAGTILALPTDSAILNSEEFKLRKFTVGGKFVAYTSGSFTQYKTVKWTGATSLPNGLDARTAAATCVSGLTALTSLKEAYEVKKGDTILVHAVAGGLGLQLTQLATLLGANVIGTTSTPEKAALAKANGAKEVILYTKESVVERVEQITGGKGVAAIYDGVGKDTWEDNFKIIARKGTIVSIGNASGTVPPFAVLKLTPKNVKVVRPTFVNYLATPEESTAYTTEYYTLLAEGKVKVDIHGEYEYSAEGVRKAQADITGRGSTGKLLIKVE